MAWVTSASIGHIFLSINRFSVSITKLNGWLAPPADEETLRLGQLSIEEEKLPASILNAHRGASRKREKPNKKNKKLVHRRTQRDWWWVDGVRELLLPSPSIITIHWKQKESSSNSSSSSSSSSTRRRRRRRETNEAQHSRLGSMSNKETNKRGSISQRIGSFQLGTIFSH